MLIALDSFGKKIFPFPGGKGFCPQCKSSVVAICGEINIWHWRHENIADCDNWSEGETEWHIKWKNEFPKDWQEITIENEYGIIHRADIKTPNRIVLELQNSPISTIDIENREYFYGKMFWLINAENFKENIKKYSIVTKMLREHDKYDPTSDEFIVRNYLYEELKELEEISMEIEKNEKEISRIKGSLLHLQSLEPKVENLSYNTLINYFYYSEIGERLNLDIRPIKEYQNQIETHEQEIIKFKNIIKNIDSLPNCDIRYYEHYKICHPKAINSSIYKHCALIEKNQTLFPEIITFESEYKYNLLINNPNFYLIVDFTEHIKNLENNISNSEEQISLIQHTINDILQNLGEKTKNYINEKKSDLIKELSAIISDSKKNENLYDIRLNKINELDNEYRSSFEKEKLENIKSHEKEKYEIMRKYKNQYEYYWKNERKTWQFSKKRKFLDFGDKIFEIIDSERLKKYSRIEFINLIKGL